MTLNFPGLKTDYLIIEKSLATSNSYFKYILFVTFHLFLLVVLLSIINKVLSEYILEAYFRLTKC